MGIINKIISLANTDISKLFKKNFSLNVYQENLETNLKETTKRINKDSFVSQVTTGYGRFSSTEYADSGEYGYSTRQDIDFTEVEQCFNDPKVSQCLDRIIDEIFADPLTLENKDDSDESLLLLNYNNQLKEEIEGDIEDALELAVKTALFVGHYVGEIVPKWSENIDFQGKRVISYIQSIRLGLIEFITDDHDRPQAIHSLVDFNEYYPLDRFFILRLGGLWDDVYGGSLFRKIRPYWKAKLMVRDDMLITSNRYSQPITNVTYSDDTLRETAQKISDSLYAGVNMALPEGVKAGFIDAGLKGESPHMVILEYLDKMISFGICGYDLSTEIGSRAADEVKGAEKSKRVSRIRRKICNAYSEQIIRRFTKNNYPVDQFPLSLHPIAKFYVEDNIDRKEFAETTELSINIGAVDFEKRPPDLIFYRQRMGWPDLSEDEIEELMKPSESIDLEEETETDKQEVKLFNYGHN